MFFGILKLIRMFKISKFQKRAAGNGHFQRWQHFLKCQTVITVHLVYQHHKLHSMQLHRLTAAISAAVAAIIQ